MDINAFLTIGIVVLAVIVAWGADREWRRPSALDVAREAAAREANTPDAADRFRSGSLDNLLDAGRDAVELDRSGWRP